ncbi:glycosyltransferase family 4 protein [Luethyella okanaganae]|uniref:Glycosyltransferase family 4 protein n=1 Tax=Luethyella okanaganae TaxID=69372 RepID=A0ABW1VA54_9MICO
MTRVLVDLLFFTGKKGGMESYVREVYGRMPSHPEIEFVGLASTELAATDTSWFPGTIVDSGVSGENRAAWALGELFGVSRFARRLDADLVHCPANLGPARSRVPVVLTIHDLLPFRHPEYVPGPYARVLRAMIRRAARRACRVLTVSRASRDDIVRYLSVPAARVDVVPLSGTGRAGAVAGGPRLDDQVLAVGNRMPHKNFPLLLEALALLPAESRPRLVVTGGHGADPLTPVVERLGLGPWVSLHGWLDPTELDALYAESTMVVFPTLFEGFGLPPLEAMSRGCPVVCSDLPVLHEVAGDAAAYVDPHSAASVARGIGDVLASTETRERMSLAGLARAAEFSWERTARQTLDSLQRALAER